MKVIHKQTLGCPCEASLLMPPGSVIFRANVQGGSVCIWYEFPASAVGNVSRTFNIFFTGMEIPDHAKHIETFLLSSGDIVMHLYETTEPRS